MSRLNQSLPVTSPDQLGATAPQPTSRQIFAASVPVDDTASRLLGIIQGAGQAVSAYGQFQQNKSDRELDKNWETASAQMLELNRQIGLLDPTAENFEAENQRLSQEVYDLYELYGVQFQGTRREADWQGAYGSASVAAAKDLQQYEAVRLERMNKVISQGVRATIESEVRGTTEDEWTVYQAEIKELGLEAFTNKIRNDYLSILDPSIRDRVLANPDSDLAYRVNAEINEGVIKAVSVSTSRNAADQKKQAEFEKAQALNGTAADIISGLDSLDNVEDRDRLSVMDSMVSNLNNLSTQEIISEEEYAQALAALDHLKEQKDFTLLGTSKADAVERIRYRLQTNKYQEHLDQYVPKEVGRSMMEMWENNTKQAEGYAVAALYGVLSPQQIQEFAKIPDENKLKSVLSGRFGSAARDFLSSTIGKKPDNPKDAVEGNSFYGRNGIRDANNTGTASPHESPVTNAQKTLADIQTHYGFPDIVKMLADNPSFFQDNPEYAELEEPIDAALAVIQGAVTGVSNSDDIKRQRLTQIAADSVMVESNSILVEADSEIINSLSDPQRFLEFNARWFSLKDRTPGYTNELIRQHGTKGIAAARAMNVVSERSDFESLSNNERFSLFQEAYEETFQAYSEPTTEGDKSTLVSQFKGVTAKDPANPGFFGDSLPLSTNAVRYLASQAYPSSMFGNPEDMALFGINKAPEKQDVVFFENNGSLDIAVDRVGGTFMFYGLTKKAANKHLSDPINSRRLVSFLASIDPDVEYSDEMTSPRHYIAARINSQVPSGGTLVHPDSIPEDAISLKFRNSMTAESTTVLEFAPDGTGDLKSFEISFSWSQYMNTPLPANAVKVMDHLEKLRKTNPDIIFYGTTTEVNAVRNLFKLSPSNFRRPAKKSDIDI